MTDDALSDYLQSIGGLINGFKPTSSPIIESRFFQTGKGWNQLIYDLIRDLMELGWDKTVFQVKEKFGGLCFYVGTSSPEILDRISQATRESYTICEVTGSPGKLRKDIGWWKTLCDSEYNIKKEKL